MSETVLSTLCSICHAQPPKYKCPRCGVRTCSVPCIKKHKSRADCDGVRNPRAFMPLKQLRTESGVDHDFNFLTSIERARQRSERDLVEVRRLLSDKELRPPNEDKAFQKVWHGDELRHVPVQAQSHAKHGWPKDGVSFIDGFDKHVRRRLRYLDIEVITMPKGMARPRENKTAFNRRTSSINWQVEWLVYGALPLGPSSSQPQHQQPIRILRKSLEGSPLYASLASAIDWRCSQQDGSSRGQQHVEGEAEFSVPKKKRKTRHHHDRMNQSQEQELPPVAQDSSTTSWPAAPCTIQSTLTGAWDQPPGAEPTLEESLSTWQFFLVRVNQTNPAADSSSNSTSRHTKKLTPLSPFDTLTAALSGRTVIEFPTIHALPPGSPLPEGWVLGDAKERREPKPKPPFQGGHGKDSNEKDHVGHGGRKRPFDHAVADDDKTNPSRGSPVGRGGKRGQFGARPQRGADLAAIGAMGSEERVAAAVDAQGAEEAEVSSEEDEVSSSDEGEVSSSDDDDDDGGDGGGGKLDLNAAAAMDVDVADDGVDRDGTGNRSPGSVTLDGGVPEQEEQMQVIETQPLGGGGKGGGGGGLVDYGSSDDE